MINTPQQIFPIGFGSFGVGAEATENISKSNVLNPSEQLDSLLFAFSLGENYIESSYHYAAGNTLQFLAIFFKKIPREKIFITTKLFAPIHNKQDVERQLGKALQLMEIDYVDSLNCTQNAASFLPIDEVYSLMSDQINKGATRFLSGSNLNLSRLKLLEKNNLKLFSLEGLYNLECKVNEDLGIIKYCSDHNILFAAYQPLRRNKTSQNNYPTLLQLAEKYHKTQNQIILNWISKYKKLFILNKSVNKQHIRENIESLHFLMEADDYLKLDKFRRKEFDKVIIDWDNKGGIPIYNLPNLFL